MQALAVFRDMSAFCRTGVAREVNSDIVDAATRNFSRVEECRNHGRTNLVGAAYKTLDRFMSRKSKQPLVIIRV